VELVLRAALLEVVAATLATDGDVDPPHPDASSERPARAPTNDEERTLRTDIVLKRSTSL